MANKQAWIRADRLQMRQHLALTDYPDPMVHIACPKCGRSGRLSKARLIAEHGAAIPLPDLRHVLAACPRRGQMSDPCEAVFPDLALP
jgi:hypothetical protein